MCSGEFVQMTNIPSAFETQFYIDIAPNTQDLANILQIYLNIYFFTYLIIFSRRNDFDLLLSSALDYSN